MRLFSKSLIKSKIQDWDVRIVGTRQETSTSLSGYAIPFVCVAYGYDTSNNPLFIGSGDRTKYDGTRTESAKFDAISSDGLNWDNYEYDSTLSNYNEAIWANNKFYSAANIRGVKTSTDGKIWSYLWSQSEVNVQSLAYGNGTYFGSCGQGKYCESSDGANWNTVSLNTFRGGKVRYLNNLFVSSGDSAGYITSYNGSLFTLHRPSNSHYWNSLTYGNGKYLFVGNNGYITTSTDLDNWTTPTKITDADIYDVTFANGQFCAVGYKTTSADKPYTGFIATSKDGINWDKKDKDTYGWKSVTYGNGYFVAVGEYRHTEYVLAYDNNSTFRDGVVARKLA